MRSPSSRRAWIEIFKRFFDLFLHLVALLAEGVDRNLYEVGTGFELRSHPPRGGRG